MRPVHSEAVAVRTQLVAEVVLVAVGRYVAAHSPTMRAFYQTADIARRLHRGEDLYEEDGAKAGAE